MIEEQVTDTALDGAAAIMYAVSEYEQDVGTPPDRVEDLVRAPAGIDGWNGPYLESVPQDSWGTPYRYRRLEHEYETVSAGPDKVFDTADDLR